MAGSRHRSGAPDVARHLPQGAYKKSRNNPMQSRMPHIARRAQQARTDMSIEIEVLNGDESWPMVEPLLGAVWPPHVVEKLAWAGIVFAHADLRVLVQAEPEGVVCHVGIYRRDVTWNGLKVRAGGIGGVATRADFRRRGYASIALNAAIQTLRDE